METTKNAKVEAVDMKLEVVVLGVSDVDRTKAFYENLGWRLDADIARGPAVSVETALLTAISALQRNRLCPLVTDQFSIPMHGCEPTSLPAVIHAAGAQASPSVLLVVVCPSKIVAH
jgi:catechol 2,3-dioxygenase-like lactoylglutathione lyase family enzyme